jgi:dTDP-4-amino-4,6-dideoxygalactose transaminase
MDSAERKIPFADTDLSESEIEEVVDTLKSGWVTTGPKTKKFEKNLADFCNTKNMVCLNSATSAEELNLRVLGVKPGDEVIVPAYTYTATASAAIHCGAKVTFIDTVKDGDAITNSPEMDYDAVANAITEHTKAIIPVDFGGVMCDYDKIFQVVEQKKNLFNAEGTIQEKIGRVAVVSDSAHGLGATRHGKKSGQVADFTSFSFHAVKNMTTGEGGASAWNIEGVDNEKIYKQYQLFSLHGQDKSALAKTRIGSWEYDIVGPWYKCNMADTLACIGLRQLERYPQMLEKRKDYIGKYDAVCDGLGLFHLKHSGVDYQSSGHLYITRIPDIGEQERNEIITKLAELGVGANVHYKPLPMMTAYKAYGWDIKDFPNAYDYYHNLITLPLYTKMTGEDVDYVIEVFSQVVKDYI